MKKILVTGGAGFIGSNFIRYYLNAHKDVKIKCFDLLTYAGNLDNLNDLKDNSRFEFAHGDIRNRKQVQNVISDCDGVIHFAAESHVDRSILDATDFYTTNFNGTCTMLAEAQRKGVERFLHISTDEVYGSIETGLFTEESPINPTNPYSASKASSDLVALAYQKTYKLPVVVTRSSNNFGPYQYPEKVIPVFITNLLEDKKIPLYGDGLNVRDWIFVEDNCRGIDTVFNKGNEGEVYNIGGGNEIPNIELAHIILERLGKDESSIQYVKDRLAHDRRYALDSTKTRALGWQPEQSYKEAIAKTVDWYKENQDWWRKIKTKSAEYKKFMEKNYQKV